jgi:hypothetical protein
MSTYKILMIFLVIFTALDTIVTKIGINLGCVELNPFVNNLGLDLWTIFRALLLVYLLTTFFMGRRICQNRSSTGLFVLKNGLWAINIYIGAIVFSGIFHILSVLV